jgi:hypothetical protein
MQSKRAMKQLMKTTGSNSRETAADDYPKGGKSGLAKVKTEPTLT